MPLRVNGTAVIFYIYAILVEGSHLNQCDTDGDGYGNIYDPDLDNNLIVQAADLSIFKLLFFTTDPHADFDCNGIVQAVDWRL